MDFGEPPTRTSRGPGRPRGTVASTRDVTRARILDAATELFAAKGFHAASVAEISLRADIKTGALYHHIGSKEELLWSILRRYTAKALASVSSVGASEREPVEKLGGLIDIHVAIIIQHRQEVAIQLRDADALSPEHAIQLQALRQGVQDVWESAVSACCPSMRSAEVRIAVSGLLGMINSLWFWYRPERGDSAAEISRSFRSLALYGLANK